jgi:hypothetical protein
MSTSSTSSTSSNTTAPTRRRSARSRPGQPWPKERQLSDCWDWITPEEALKAALSSFYDSSRLQQAEPGKPWVSEDGTGYGSRESFIDEMVTQFRLRIYAIAHDRKVMHVPEMIQELQRVETHLQKLKPAAL